MERIAAKKCVDCHKRYWQWRTRKKDDVRFDILCNCRRMPRTKSASGKRNARWWCKDSACGGSGHSVSRLLLE